MQASSTAPRQVSGPRRLELDGADIANSARARRWHELNYNPLTSDDDRALEERLCVSVRMCDWRRKAGLPTAPPHKVATIWRQHLQLLWALGAYRRRHPRVPPINQTAA